MSSDTTAGRRAGPGGATTANSDPYDAPAVTEEDALEGTVVTVGGGDWDEVVDTARLGEERIVVNMGPQHPSTHGVLRLVLEIEGETVTEARAGIGYLHTGIEKNMEYRNWVQGVTFCTRMDYLSPTFNETAYCLGVERLLGITDEVPARAGAIRVLVMELNRIGSHLVALATGGMELGSTTVMMDGFRERDKVLAMLEEITGLRMNHAFVRPGGVAMDVTDVMCDHLDDMRASLGRGIRDLELLMNQNPTLKARLVSTGYLNLAGCMALGITGPPVRSAGLPLDLRRDEPYCGYEDYDFDVVTRDEADNYARLRIRVEEMWQSLRIIQQVTDRLRKEPGPVMVADKKIAWPSQISLGGDGLGNSLDHIRHIMGESMEALIHHFKLVTEGFRVPAGQVYTAVESPRGELGCHLVSSGGTRPFRAHFRDPSFTNLQAIPLMCEGAQVADVVANVASLDPVMGGVDR
jgi:NADH-quinone oxidoreductase subunit D